MDQAISFLKQYYQEDVDDFSDEPEHDIYKTAMLRLLILDEMESPTLLNKFIILCLLDIWSTCDSCLGIGENEENAAEMKEVTELLLSLGHDPLKPF